MEKPLLDTLMVTAMKDNILMESEKAEEFIDMQMEKSTMENGLTILNMESEEKLMINLVNTMATGKTVKDMVKEYFITKMEIFTLDGGNLEKKKAQEPTHSSQQE